MLLPHAQRYTRHTGRHPSSSASDSSHTPTATRLSPHSSVPQWLQTVDLQAPPPPSPALPASQPVSLQSGVTSSMSLRFSASHLAPQRIHSPQPSLCSRRSHVSSVSATVIQGIVDFSSRVTDNMAHLTKGLRTDAIHREEAMRQEDLERERMQKQEATEIRHEAALRGDRS